MPYNALPTEVKQMIVDEVSKSDQAATNRLQTSTSPPSSVIEALREEQGKTLGRLSRVSKELRSLCEPALFESLNAYRTVTEDFDIFIDDHILKHVRRLVVDRYCTEDEFIHFALHVVRRLPNLNRVSFDGSDATRLLMEQHEVDDSRSNPRFETARKKMIEATKTIPDWTIVMETTKDMPRQFQDCSASHVLRLSLHVEGFEGFHRRTPRESTFPDLVQRCKNLQALVLKMQNVGNWEINHLTMFPSHITDSHYPFVESLTSLTISLGMSHHAAAAFDPSGLIFATLFPHLRYLKVAANRFKYLPGANAFGPHVCSFPALVELEVSFFDEESFHAFFKHLSLLPKLNTLQLVFTRDLEHWALRGEGEWEKLLVPIIDRINRLVTHPSLSPSSRKLFLHLSSPQKTPPSLFVDIFRRRLLDLVYLSFDWFEGDPFDSWVAESRYRSPLLESRVINTREELALYEREKTRHRTDLVSGTKRLAQFVIDEMEKLGAVEDYAGAARVYGLMRPLEEYRRWKNE